MRTIHSYEYKKTNPVTELKTGISNGTILDTLMRDYGTDDDPDGKTTLLNAMENFRERLAALIGLNIINFNQLFWVNIKN